jgi:hypothetical protein
MIQEMADIADPWDLFYVLGTLEANESYTRSPGASATRVVALTAAEFWPEVLQRLLDSSEEHLVLLLDASITETPPDLDQRISVVTQDQRAAWWDWVAAAALDAGSPEGTIRLFVPVGRVHQARHDFETLSLLRPESRPNSGVGPILSLDRGEALRRLDAARAAADGTLAGDPWPPRGGIAEEIDELIVVDATTALPRLSRLASLYERSAFEQASITPYAASAKLLSRHGWNFEAEELETLVLNWVTQRLWSLNCVPELVAHDDRHVERVDHLVSQLVEPLLDVRPGWLANAPLEAEDLVVLSSSAWLHDWGHVGGCLPGSDVHIEDPLLVRHFHGLLSRYLVENDELLGMHGLAGERAKRVAILCAHHQGWTSFGTEPYRTASSVAVTAYRKTTGLQPTSLDADLKYSVGAIPGDSAYRRERLLVALLRVADAADVGFHRVPDTPSRQAFETLRLARYRAMTLREVRHPSAGKPLNEDLCDKLCEDIRGISLKRGPADQNVEMRLPAITEASVRRQLEQLMNYLTFIREAREHQMLHGRVRSVSFSITRRRDGTLAFKPRVLTCLDSREGAEAAVGAVDGYIQEELKRGSKDASVRSTLEEAGLFYESPGV